MIIMILLPKCHGTCREKHYLWHSVICLSNSQGTPDFHLTEMIISRSSQMKISILVTRDRIQYMVQTCKAKEPKYTQPIAKYASLCTIKNNHFSFDNNYIEYMNMYTSTPSLFNVSKKRLSLKFKLEQHKNYSFKIRLEYIKFHRKIA